MSNPTRALVIVAEWPAPDSNDALLRKLTRLIMELSKGADVAVLAVEPGGAVVTDPPFTAIDTAITGGRPAAWLRSTDERWDKVICTDIFAPNVEAAIARLCERGAGDGEGTERIALLSRLPSHTASTAEGMYRAPDASGLPSLVDAQREHEAAVLGRCDHALGLDPYVADAALGISRLITHGPGPERLAFSPTPGRRLLHIGRWATGAGADAIALRRFLALPSAQHERLPQRTTLVGEDCSPAGRQVTRDHPRLELESDLTAAVARGAVALVTPASGPIPTQRVRELAGLGVPMVLSRLAAKALMKELPVGDFAPWVAESDEQSVEIACRLLDDDDAWQEASDHLAAWAEMWHNGFGILGADFTPGPTIPRTYPVEPSWTVTRPHGAFDFQREMRRFEEELIPAPALDRDDTALLQPNMTEDERYRLKLRVHERPSYYERCAEAAERLGSQPTFSIVMPTYNIDRATLLSAVESVRSQIWPHWELCIADDASPNDETCETVRSLPSLDDRITVTQLSDNRGIAGATNAAIELATGDFIGFLDHDDELRPDALWWYARLLDARPDLDVIYSDEDKLDGEGDRWWPFHKPDWSPAMLTNVNYMTHFLVTRASHLRAVGGVREGFDGAQDYDLILRLTAATERHRIGHVAKPLYSWRVIEGSTSGDVEAKPAAHDAGHRALSDWVATQPRGEQGRVEDGSVPTVHFVRYGVPDDAKVSVIIPTRDRVDLMRLCLHSVREKTDFANYELIVVDNNSTDPETLDWLREFERDDGLVLRYPHQFNYGRQMNLAAVEATGELLLFLNNDAQVHTDHWMRAMAEQALLPDVGAVGARLMFPDGRTQHEGIGLGMAGPAVNLSFGGHRGYDQFIRDCVAVTGAAMMMRATVFDDVGGFDDKLRVAFNDVDLCLRLSERGYRNVYTPLAELGHPESASRGSLHPIPDEDLYHRRWGTIGELRDPWLNPNFEWFHPLLYRI